MNCINHLSVLEPAKVNIFKIFSGSYFQLYDQTCTNVYFNCSEVCFGKFCKSK